MTMDLFAKLDPNAERERLFAADAAEVLATRLVAPVAEGELKYAALDLSRSLVTLAQQRFGLEEDEGPERMLVLEIGIILLVHLDRSPSAPNDVALELGRRLAALARKRFFPEKQGKKKDT